MSKIEWTDETWNPVTGCAKVSPGCRNCYAERMSARLEAMGNWKYRNGFRLTVHTGALEEPLRWRKPRRVFVCSMSDLFHKDVGVGFLERVFHVMQSCPEHTFQVLTKRPERAAELAGVLPWPENVWVGTSVEDEARRFRIEQLARIPARVRFLSCEPLLGPLELREPWLSWLSWVIVGGESGPGARPMHPDWPRKLRDDCVDAGVPFFFKQWGRCAPWLDPARFTYGGAERAPHVWVDGDTGANGRCWIYDDDGSWQNYTKDPRAAFDVEPLGDRGPGRIAVMAPVGKKAAGRKLDGRTWDQFPELGGAA